MAGRARTDFERYAETAGLPLPPAGAVAGYATEVLGKIPALRARCGEDDEETLHALREMESIARGLLRWIELAAEIPQPVSRARAVFTIHAEAAGLPVPPPGELSGYATDALSKIPALRAGCDEEMLHHLQAVQKSARALLRWIGKPLPQPAGVPVPAAHQLGTRAARRRAAMRAKSRSAVQDGWAD